MGSFASSAVAPIKTLLKAVKARADLGVKNAATAHAAANAAQATADAAMPRSVPDAYSVHVAGKSAATWGRRGLQAVKTQTIMTREKGDYRYLMKNAFRTITDVTASRTTGTLYRNTTGKTMFLILSMRGRFSRVRVGPDGQNVIDVAGVYDGGHQDHNSRPVQTVIVPNGWFYDVHGYQPVRWVEVN